MAGREIKAYSLYGSREFVEKTYDEATKERIFAGLSQEAKDVLASPKKLTVVRPEFASEIWRGIVKVHEGRASEVYDRLRACGRYSGEYATNTYLRLLFKILSVKAFASKLPEIWSRDCSFGKITTDISALKSGKLKLTFTDLNDYPYFGPNCEGWFAFTFETMGLKNVKVELKDWSLKNPDPGKLEYQVTWSA
jgi:hypothetical protein